jgi:hypothetical protein
VITAATGAKNGCRWPTSSVAISHDVALARQICTTTSQEPPTRRSRRRRPARG